MADDGGGGPGAGPGPGFARWWLVAASAMVMGVAGTYQFVWSSIRAPLGAHLGASEAALGTVFTLFVIFQTVSQFPAGWVRDRYGPRVPLSVGAVLMTAGYAGTALAGSVEAVYVAYALGGAGAGVGYTVAVNTPVKWFTKQRGLATGVVTMSYSGGSFLLIPAVRRGLDAAVAATLLALGALAGLTALAAALVVQDPPDVATGAGRDGDPTEDAGDPNGPYTWRQAVRTWQFWLLYAVFIAVNGVGLMVIGKVVSFAGELGLPGAAATAAASLVALADAGGVLVVGGLSDRLGRERTTGATLLLCGASLAASVAAGEAGLAWPFVALIGASAFFRSPPFAIFPSITGSYFGEAYSSENYAALYTAKLWGGVLGGTVASALVVAVGWSTAFLLGAGVVAAAGLAAFPLRPV